MITKTELLKLCKQNSDSSVGKILGCSPRTVCNLRKKYGIPAYFKNKPKVHKKCKIRGCNRMDHMHGWCRAHYERWLKHGDPEAGYNSRGVRLQFVREAINSNTDECIIFPFVSPSQRYGLVKLRGKQRLAHRVVCRTVHGPAPTPEHEVGHRKCCTSSLCINPRHIRWVTHSRNNYEDKINQGTIVRGKRHPKNKLSKKDVYKIREMYDSGSRPIDIAYIFDVTPTNIVKIGKRKAWYWLEEK